MDDDFIKMEHIAITTTHKEDQFDPSEENLEKELQKNGKYVYQLQGCKDENKIFIANVGIFMKPPDIIISQFKLKKKFDCILISCIHDFDILKQMASIKKFDIFKIIIQYRKYQIASVYLHFHPENMKSIDRYLLVNKISPISGKFTVCLEANDKIYLLEEFYLYPGQNKIIEKIIKNIGKDIVGEIFEEIIKQYNI